MAERRQAEDEFNPRHRIVGAVILVALAVIFLPMVLNDRPQEPTATRTAELPVADTPVAVSPAPSSGVAGDTAAIERPTGSGTRIVTVPVEPAPATSSRATASMPATRPAASTKPAIETPLETPVPPARKAPAPAPERTATVTKGWIVQVGVFSQLDNAQRLQERLKSGGYPAVLHPPAAEAGKTVRVEVGPYADQALARSAAARIQREFGIKGIVRSQ